MLISICEILRGVVLLTLDTAYKPNWLHRISNLTFLKFLKFG